MAVARLPPHYYTSELNRTNWEVPEKYQDLSPIGNGAYGQVCSSLNVQSNKRVAIKKLARPFQTITHAKRTYRELRLLHHMKHENVINLLDVFSPCLSFDTFSDVYFVSDLMGADLNTVNKCQKLSDEHVKFLVYQILRGLKYIHSAGVIHRDLKPSNLAVNEDCELRILDFGLARMTDDEMTGYVATRWYRAPEIMLNWMHYRDKVDMWSVGCIMAELLTSQVLFPGNDNIDQLNLILRVTGTPGEEFLHKIESDNDIEQLTKIFSIIGSPPEDFINKIESESARDYVRSLENYPRKDFRRFFEGASPLAIDILEKMLELDSDRRPSAADALAHDYFSQFHDPTDEPTAEPFNDEFENADYQLQHWKGTDPPRLPMSLAHDYFSEFHGPTYKPTSEPFSDEFENADNQLPHWKEKVYQLIVEIKNGIPY